MRFEQRTGGRGVTRMLLVGGLAACAPEGSDVRDGVDALPYLRAEPTMRLGNADDPDVGFSFVGSVDVDRDGNVYVVEASVPEIRVFDPAGALIRSFGGRGDGPGEFQQVQRLGVFGDTVWAVSMGPDRVTLFDRRGNLLSANRAESLPIPLPSGAGWLVPWQMRADGLFIGHFARVSFSQTDSAPVDTDSIPFPFVRFDPSGAVQDTVGWSAAPPPRMWSPPSERSPEPEMIDVGGRPRMVPAPPPTTPWWVPLSDGYLLVDPAPEAATADGTFSVTRFGLSGERVFHREIPSPPVPYSEADLDSIAARAARGAPGGGVAYRPGAPAPPDWEAVAPRLRAAMRFPENRLPIDFVWAGHDESIWLRLSDGNEVMATWLLLDATGQPRGSLEMPRTTGLRWARGDTLWAVETDDLDIPWLVRFRLVADGR